MKGLNDCVVRRIMRNVSLSNLYTESSYEKPQVYRLTLYKESTSFVCLM